jgi:Holliday junction resolvase RusA-like endonuclease
MKIIAFHVPGKPKPQKRPIVMKRGWTIDPPESKKAKKIIGQYAMIAMADQATILEGPAAVTLTFYGAHPLSDIDNLSKLVLDALKGICWRDDRQVKELHVFNKSNVGQGTYIRIEGER